MLSYVTDIFGKMNILNIKLQGKQLNVVEAKSHIFAFIQRISLMRDMVSRGNFSHFNWLLKCDDIQESHWAIFANHLSSLYDSFNDRFVDLKNTTYPSWFLRPFDCDLATVDEMQILDSLLKIRNDETFRQLWGMKKLDMWITTEMETQHHLLFEIATKFLLPFASTYLVE